MIKESEFVELGCHSDHIIGIAAIFRDRIEEIEISVLLMYKTRNERRMLIVLAVGFLVDRPFDVVIKSQLGEIFFEDSEPMHEEHYVNEITVQSQSTYTVSFLQHDLLSIFYDGFVGFDFVTALESV
jgi:hypothetical protein